jgi:hypothetical protein
MSNGQTGRNSSSLRQAPGTVSIADALARARRDDFKPGTRDITTAERIYRAQAAAVVTANVSASGPGDGRMRWIVLGAIAAACLAIAVVAALFTTLSASGPSKPSTEGGTRVTDVADVLYLKTETGQVVNPLKGDFAKAGSNYQVHYHENGRFTLSANGYAQSGYFLIDNAVICRSEDFDTVGDHCLSIFRMDDGTYQARDETGGKLRYTFRMG